ncbi:hypothetical protein GNI_020370 [Gregarina niphandrodes]|uniref:Uncharacterized protein n=1 Tax=Gregarina niphandrodes TaxID=110365 RepID=A0A023BBT7_GRENI|nr:hypothetical protein GNI_020370 [Gregarina niphandrodes]EZG81035.1 hypothetical protein GNI_020370 [Gregarina niphandrodes]|eukprot:XP_011134274.1 hypothetical protein GNI_020370 [Gregarina niphandrodes]
MSLPEEQSENPKVEGQSTLDTGKSLDNGPDGDRECHGGAAVSETPVDELPSGEVPAYLCQDPYELKERGNRLYETEKYMEAVEMWKQGLKRALQKSVRDPSMEWVALQTRLRLNIAQGFIKYEDYVMAKEHLMVIMDHDPTNSKAIFRLAQVYDGLQDFEKAVGILRRGIQLHPEEAAFKVLYNELVIKERDSRQKSPKTVVDLNAIKDIRSEPVIEKPRLDVEQYRSILIADEPVRGEAVMGDEAVTGNNYGAVNDLRQKMIEWKCKIPLSDTPTRVEQQDHVDGDLDDWHDKMWLSVYTHERLVDDKTVLQHSLPLSVLYGLDCVLFPYMVERPKNIMVDLCSGARLTLPELAWVPVEGDSRSGVSPKVGCGELGCGELGCGELGLKAEERMSVAHALTRTGTNPFTIHVLNARGDDEMEVKWSSMLKRLPSLDNLQTIMIGFCDPSDPYSKTLTASDYLSPQLSQTSMVRGVSHKLLCRLYKGAYLEFLDSESVKKQTKTAHLTCQEVNGVKVSPILTNPNHPFHPDLVVVPQCNLSRRFDEYIPVLAMLCLTNTLILFLGHSSCEFPSHEAVQLPDILKELNARFITQPYWNPFMLPVKPDDDCPPMNVLKRNPDGSMTAIDFKGVSAKYAFGLWIKGFINDSEKLLTDLIKSSENVQAFKLKLKAQGIDVDREEMAVQTLENDTEYKTRLSEIVTNYENSVKEKTLELSRSIQEKLHAT